MTPRKNHIRVFCLCLLVNIILSTCHLQLLYTEQLLPFAVHLIYQIKIYLFIYLAKFRLVIILLVFRVQACQNYSEQNPFNTRLGTGSNVGGLLGKLLVGKKEINHKHLKFFRRLHTETVTVEEFQEQVFVDIRLKPC